MKPSELDPHSHAYLCGYWDALEEHGYYNIRKEVSKILMQAKLKFYEIDVDEFLDTMTDVQEANE